jgi:hypothetical protein
MYSRELDGGTPHFAPAIDRATNSTWLPGPSRPFRVHPGFPQSIFVVQQIGALFGKLIRQFPDQIDQAVRLH